MDLTEKARRCREFIEALDDERRKIQLFQRELPLCLQLVEQTIESYKRMVDVAASPREEEPVPVLKEFMSLSPSGSTVVPEGNHESSTVQGAFERRENWMASSHLWTQAAMDPALSNSDIRQVPERPIAVKAKKSWGYEAAERFDINKESDAAAVVPLDASSNEANSSEELDEEHCGGSDAVDGEEKKDGKSAGKRKARRCWSEELHRRFLDAIQQLGGCDAATPKQIREVMKVDGLTNDEVKSHLQKFRLHSRRNSPNGQGTTHSAPTAHFVLVGGIWIPPPTGSSAADASEATVVTNVQPASGVFTPILSLPSNLVFQDQNNQLLLDMSLNRSSPKGPLHEHNRSGDNLCINDHASI